MRDLGWYHTRWLIKFAWLKNWKCWRAFLNKPCDALNDKVSKSNYRRGLCELIFFIDWYTILWLKVKEIYYDWRIQFMCHVKLIPFKSFEKSIASSWTSGVTLISDAERILIAYAASPEKGVLSSSEHNSHYTKQLLHFIKQPFSFPNSVWECLPWRSASCFASRCEMHSQMEFGNEQ